MPLSEVGTRIVVFLSEDDRISPPCVARGGAEPGPGRRDGRGHRVARCRGVRRLGAVPDRTQSPDANIGLPVAVELVDTPERIEAFLPVIKELAPGSFVTREEVKVTRFGLHDHPLRSTTPAQRNRRAP